MAFDDDAQITNRRRYHLPNVKIIDCNVMIDRNFFFDQTVKFNKITYENIRKIATGQWDDCTTGCLLDYPYFKKNYKMISID